MRNVDHDSRPGTRLGLYEVVSPLGAGGIGEVSRARDTRLRRGVAVKALLARMPQNSELGGRASGAGQEALGFPGRGRRRRIPAWSAPADRFESTSTPP